ncbi:hypothetical protein ACSAZL_07880 [Methanosarcina sp. T3]|uniref:hypothetical protein n=1 Tax=Methanosarcina sp. T3 TaxID=3439062 RepID=UPI003F82B766
MTLSKLFVIAEDSYPGLLRVYNPLKGYRASKKYEIPDFLLGGFFDLKTVKIAQEIEKKIFNFFNKTIQALLYRKELAAFPKAPEKMALHSEGFRVW